METTVDQAAVLKQFIVNVKNGQAKPALDNLRQVIDIKQNERLNAINNIEPKKE